MEVTIEIPDTVAVWLNGQGTQIPRWLLERVGLEAYKAREISAYDLRQMLGFETGLELDGFLKRHGIELEYSAEDFARDAETSRLLKEARRQ